MIIGDNSFIVCYVVKEFKMIKKEMLILEKFNVLGI